MLTIVQIAIGGALGAVCRWASVTLTLRLFGDNPANGLGFGTMAVNILGSFLMGLAFVFFIERAYGAAGSAAPLVMTGFLGGFTTFSAYSLEAILLLERGRYAFAAFYIGGSVVLSIAALVLGIWLAREVLT